MKDAIRIIMVVATLLAAGAAAAQSPWYVFGSLGQTRSSGPGGSDDELRAEGFSGIQSSSTYSYSSAGLGAGYMLSNRFALEASWQHLGEIGHYGATFPVPPDAVGTRSKSWKASAFGLSAIANIGTWDEITPFVKASLYNVRGEFKKTTTITVNSPFPAPGHSPGQLLRNDAETSSGSAVAPALGVGASLAIGPGAALRASYEIMGKASAFGSGNDLGNLKMLTFALTYRL